LCSARNPCICTEPDLYYEYETRDFKCYICKSRDEKEGLMNEDAEQEDDPDDADKVWQA
jgi:hypothetical protein